MSESKTPRTDAAPPVYDGFPSTVSRDFARQLETQLAAKDAELKALNETHGIQLAAISTACIQNTDASVRGRIGRDNPYWTVAYGDVCVAVDREMKLRSERDALRAAVGEAVSLLAEEDVSNKQLYRNKMAVIAKLRAIVPGGGESTPLSLKPARDEGATGKSRGDRAQGRAVPDVGVYNKESEEGMSEKCKHDEDESECPFALDEPKGQCAKCVKAALAFDTPENRAGLKTLVAIIHWLEVNQPDVFSRGIWESINAARNGGES